MKQKLLFILISVLLFNCQQDDESMPSQGYVSVGVAPDVRTTGRVNTAELNEALVIIEKATGEIAFSGKISLTAFSDGYISEQLQLSTGDYKLSRFILANDGEAKYATPVAGSPKAHLVEHPLPISFSVEENAVTRLIPEVISLAGASPGAFGYVEFGFEIVDEIPGFKTFSITATIASEESHGQAVDGIFSVAAKNSSGETTWTNSWPIANTIEISVPIAHRYSFSLTKEGHMTHSQHYRYSDLEGASDLAFELIPNDSDDFIFSQMFDGKLKLIYPADRAKVYMRMDVAEDLEIEYLSASLGTSSMTGIPLAPLYDGLVYSPAELVTRAVNLFENTPFASVQNIRDVVDMSRSIYAEDFDRDVEIDSYVTADAAHYHSFQDRLFYWDFDEQAFYRYWCQRTGNSFCDKIDGSDAGRKYQQELKKRITQSTSK